MHKNLWSRIKSWIWFHCTHRSARSLARVKRWLSGLGGRLASIAGFQLQVEIATHLMVASVIGELCRTYVAPRFSAAGMVRMKNHEKLGWVHLIWNPGLVLTAGCGETPGRARTFISDQSKEVSQDRERRRKLHRCIQTAIDSARRDWSSARRDWRLFFQTFQPWKNQDKGLGAPCRKNFQPCFVISWPISTNEPSLESLKSQQSDGAIFVPVSPRERTIAPFLRRVLTLSAQFPRTRTCSGQINLYRGEIAVWQGAVRGGGTHGRKSTEVHGHPALLSLRNGGDKLKIFALEQRSLLEPVDGKMRAHANQADVWSHFYGR